MESAVPPTTPAKPASPAPSAKVMAKMRWVLTPEAWSMARSSTPARIIMPTRVRLRNSQSAMPMTMAAPSSARR